MEIGAKRKIYPDIVFDNILEFAKYFDKHFDYEIEFEVCLVLDSIYYFLEFYEASSTSNIKLLIG